MQLQARPVAHDDAWGRVVAVAFGSAPDRAACCRPGLDANYTLENYRSVLSDSDSVAHAPCAKLSDTRNRYHPASDQSRA